MSLPTVARAAAILGAAGSVALTLYAGRNNNLPFLMVLMGGWVFAPFFGFALARRFSGRWSPATRAALDVVILIITVAALAIYTRGVLRPPQSQGARVYVAVPIVSWILLLAVGVAGFLSSRRGASLALLLAVQGGQPQQSWMFGPFAKPAQVNPVITPNPAVAWEAYATFNPAAVVKDGKIFLLYRAEDATGRQEIGGHTSRLGLAESTDGLHFTRRATPVLYPDSDAQRQNEWPGGVEDPRIVESGDGTYILTYTQWNRDVPRLAVATSRDLITWTKHGPAFAKVGGGKYLRTESKSGAILSRIDGNRIIATRVNGKYWMYFGVPDLRIATSENLLDWTPVEDSSGQAVKVLSARPGYFDSWLVEAGPPALLTRAGILVLYNAGSLPSRTYSAGQALFDTRDPTRLIARSDSAFIKPTESYERTGQYTAGTTFVEGLVPFKGRWFLYYGTADSRVGVAVWDPSR